MDSSSEMVLLRHNLRKYIHKKFLLSNPRKFPPSKLIHYTVYGSHFIHNKLTCIYKLHRDHYLCIVRVIIYVVLNTNINIP